jgi:DNA polymerase III delta prime subunit
MIINDKKEHSLWVEAYRPETLAGYVGNEDIASKVNVYIESGDIPHLLLYGPAGTGKTTLAKLIVSNIDCDVMYINASEERGIDVIRNKIQGFASTVGFTAGGKIIIMDEADYLTPEAQAALRNTMEAFSKTTRFILTCNYVEKVIDPIQSRCQVFAVTPPSKKDVAIRLVDILNNENIEFVMDDVVACVNNGYPDIRRVLNSAQRQIVKGKLVIDKRSTIISDYTGKIVEELKNSGSNKDKLMKLRTIIADSKSRTFEPLYQELFDEIDGWGKGHVGPLLLILAEAQAKDVHVVNKELNVAAMFVQILTELN